LRSRRRSGAGISLNQSSDFATHDELFMEGRLGQGMPALSHCKSHPFIEIHQRSIMSISTSKPFDQAIADSKDAGLGPSPSSSAASPQSNSASATTRPPSVVQVNDDIFKHYQTHEWIRDFKPPASASALATTSLQVSSPPVVENRDPVSTKTAESQSVKRQEISARPTPLYDMYKVVGRPSERGEIDITVCIGKLPTELPADEKYLPEIFDVMNRFTVQKPYPCDLSRILDVGDAIIFRPNHNVTHSVRQVRLLETLIECLATHGSQTSKKNLEGLSYSERLLLKLGVFCLRVGRVDETNTHAKYSDTNGWKKRSAQIFQLYASQLPAEVAPRDQIAWVSSLISVACNPEEYLPKEITENDKSNFCVHLLACVHELDLYRCYTKNDMNKPIERVKTFLFIQTEDFDKANAFQPRLEKYALDLLEATGSSIQYKGINCRRAEFGANSLDAKYCWQTTGSVEKPSW
jgi:hypothetical protein